VTAADLALQLGRPAELLAPLRIAAEMSQLNELVHASLMTVLTGLVDEMSEAGRTSPTVVAVDGMGGVGKSTVVTHFAHRVAGRFTDGQLYLDLRGDEGDEGGVAPAEALRSLLYALGVRAAYADELFRATETPDERRAALGRLLQHYLHSSVRAELMLEPYRTSVTLPPILPGVTPERPVSYRDALGWFARHREVLKEAIKVAAEAGHGIDPWHLALVMKQWMEWYGYFQDWDDVMRYALRAARDGGDRIGEGHMLRLLAGARWFLGAGEEAIELLEAARSIFADHDLAPEQAIVYVNLHRVHTALDRHDLALEDSERAVELNQNVGDRRAEVRSLDCKGQSLGRLGRHDEATQVLQRALDLNALIEYRHEDPSLRVAVAGNLAVMGRTSGAVEQYKLAADTADELSQGPYRFEAFRGLSEVLLAAGDEAGARKALCRACEVLESFQDGGPDHMRGALRRLGALQRTVRSVVRQRRMNRGDRARAFAHGGSHPLDRAGTEVADGEDPGCAGAERQRRGAQPAVGEDEALVVTGHTGHPAGHRLGADEAEQRPAVEPMPAPAGPFDDDGGEGVVAVEPADSGAGVGLDRRVLADPISQVGRHARAQVVGPDNQVHRRAPRRQRQGRLAGRIGAADHGDRLILVATHVQL
jgi:tetratricopeptide (TPR) repeat protein